VVRERGDVEGWERREGLWESTGREERREQAGREERRKGSGAGAGPGVGRGDSKVRKGSRVGRRRQGWGTGFQIQDSERSSEDQGHWSRSKRGDVGQVRRGGKGRKGEEESGQGSEEEGGMEEERMEEEFW